MRTLQPIFKNFWHLFHSLEQNKDLFEVITQGLGIIFANYFFREVIKIKLVVKNIEFDKSKNCLKKVRHY